MSLLRLSIIAILFMADSEVSVAQQIRSPEVHADRSVTFRLKSAKAQAVTVSITGKNLPLQKGESDIWSVTSEPLPPGIHDYSFDVDGTRMVDPSNRNVKKWFTLASMVEISADPPLLTEFQDVSHGVVQRLIYDSTSVGNARPVVVYTPPDYNSAADQTYPLVLLLHGFGDDETAWTEVGRAHLIADNLLASGKIQPCIIAMPYGHPVPPPFGKRPDDYFAENNDLYEKDITTDLLPFLERQFKLTKETSSRSIVGLSMGGGHAIDTGIRNIDKFSSIGAFSAAAPQLETAELMAKYPSLAGSDPAANRLRHFWIPIGDKDFLLERNETFVGQLKAAGVHFDFTKTSGGHEWKLWRDYLPAFLQKVVPAN